MHQHHGTICIRKGKLKFLYSSPSPLQRDVVTVSKQLLLLVTLDHFQAVPFSSSSSSYGLAGLSYLGKKWCAMQWQQHSASCLHSCCVWELLPYNVRIKGIEEGLFQLSVPSIIISLVSACTGETRNNQKEQQRRHTEKGHSPELHFSFDYGALCCRRPRAGMTWVV